MALDTNMINLLGGPQYSGSTRPLTGDLASALGGPALDQLFLQQYMNAAQQAPAPPLPPVQETLDNLGIGGSDIPSPDYGTTQGQTNPFSGFGVADTFSDRELNIILQLPRSIQQYMYSLQERDSHHVLSYLMELSPTEHTKQGTIGGISDIMARINTNPDIFLDAAKKSVKYVQAQDTQKAIGGGPRTDIAQNPGSPKKIWEAFTPPRTRTGGTLRDTVANLNIPAFRNTLTAGVPNLQNLIMQTRNAPKGLERGGARPGSQPQTRSWTQSEWDYATDPNWAGNLQTVGSQQPEGPPRGSPEYWAAQGAIPMSGTLPYGQPFDWIPPSPANNQDPGVTYQAPQTSIWGPKNNIIGDPVELPPYRDVYSKRSGTGKRNAVALPSKKKVR